MKNFARISRTLIALPVVAMLSLALAGCNDESQKQTTTTAAQQVADDSSGSGGTGFDSQPSDAPRINVQAVQQALAQVQSSDPDGWLQDFEKKVNEIYEGQGVVSIEAKTDASNNLQIVGYISQSGQQGFQPGDDQLFSITQTAAVANNDAPYQMQYATYGGSYGYAPGYYHNPFLTAWMVHTLVTGHTWGGYYTSPSRLVVIHDYRSSYRATPAFVTQRSATRTYYTNTYHGAPVTVRPGLRVGANPPSVQHSVAPHTGPAPQTVTPARNVGGASIFNRPNTSAPTTTRPSPAYKPYSPPKASGGLFSRSTFGGSRSSGSRRR